MRDRHPSPVRPGTASRRALVAALGAAAAGLVVPTHDATAARGWCRSDPLILVNGELADIFCTAPLSMLLNATGPTEIVVTVPKGVKAHLLLAGPGFGRGEIVLFEKSSQLKKKKGRIDVQVDVFIPAREDLPVGVEFAPRVLGILNPDTADGYANSWVTLKTRF